MIHDTNAKTLNVLRRFAVSGAAQCFLYWNYLNIADKIIIIGRSIWQLGYLNIR